MPYVGLSGKDALYLPFLFSGNIYTSDNPSTLNYCPYAITGFAYNIETNCCNKEYDKYITCHITAKKIEKITANYQHQLQ